VRGVGNKVVEGIRSVFLEGSASDQVNAYQMIEKLGGEKRERKKEL